MHNEAEAQLLQQEFGQGSRVFIGERELADAMVGYVVGRLKPG
jgi:hypothetical protein